MRVAILHNAVADDALPEDLDTLVQVRVVAEALDRLGHKTVDLACTLDLASMQEHLREIRPDMVFYLVESLADSDALAYLPAAVLDTMGIPYSGSRAESLFLTTHKILAKERLRAAGLPTPDWIEDAPDSPPKTCAAGFSKTETSPRSSWILKCIWDQGSRDMEDDSVLQNASMSEVRSALRSRIARTGRPCFAERFVDGREFSVTMLADRDGPQIHTPTEIVFPDYPPGKPRIVGYRAKWREDCPEYHQTPRRFDFAPSDRPLLEQMQSMAKTCWERFGLRGWVRVDFRVDRADQPWILEINANPCLSPDAGFFATLEYHCIPFETAIQRILNDSLTPV